MTGGHGEKKRNMRLRGQTGEDAAAQFLIQRGFSVVGRNYTVRGGEIDIIAENETHLVFVEVKSRSGVYHMNRFGRPAAAVTYEKQRHLITAARAYLTENPSDKAKRFDVAEVYMTDADVPAVLSINYIESAFVVS